MSSLNLDAVLGDLGHFGKFQKRNLFLICFVVVFSVFPMGYIFTARDIKYRCRIDDCDEDKAVFRADWLKYAVPHKGNYPSNCLRYAINSNFVGNDTCGAEYFNHSKVETCDDFVYETDDITIGREFNITCNENLWKLTIVGTVSNIGELVCLPIYGYFSDKYGRKFMMIFGGLASCFSGLIRSFMPSYVPYLVMEFMGTALGSGFYSAAFILAIELVIPEQRVIGNTILACAFALGEVMLGLAAWISPSWRVMLRIIYTPGLFFIFYVWLTHESIRWLLSKGYNDKAKAVLRKVAEMNGTKMSEEALTEENIVKEEEVEEESFFHIFSAPRLVFRLINCSYSWLCCNFVYYGLILHSVSISGNMYLNFISVALIEVPAYFLCNYTLNRIGRRLTQAPAFILSGIACLAFIFIPEDHTTVRLALFLIGKFFVTIAYAVLYMYTAEMFPTSLRHSLFATCSMFGRLGSIVAPQVPLLFNITCNENLWKLTIVGTVSNIGELVCLPIYGYFSDKYGRKFMMIFGGLATCFSGLIRSFMPSYIPYLVMEFVDTALGSGFYSAAFILAMELVIPEQRVIGNTILACAFALGEVMLGLAAWISPSWRVMLRIIYTPGLFFIFYVWLTHESIRWLLSKGYNDKAKAVLRKVAKMNGTKMSEEALTKLSIVKEEEVEEESFFHIFRAPRLVFRLINCSYSWICCTFVYYGLTLHSVSISGNMYLNFISVALIEVPAYFLCNYTLSRIGRRLTQAPAFILSGIACLAFIFIPEDHTTARLALFLIGKFFVTVAYTVLYMYTTEMFPTSLRHSLLAACSMFGRFGSMVAPQVPLLVRVWESLPLMLFGIMAFSTGILSFFFPETNKVKLPDTIEEAVEMGRKKRSSF